MMTQQQEIAVLLRELSVRLVAIASRMESNKSQARVNVQVGSILKQIDLLRWAEQKAVNEEFAKAHSYVVKVRHFLNKDSQEIAG